MSFQRCIIGRGKNLQLLKNLNSLFYRPRDASAIYHEYFPRCIHYSTVSSRTPQLTGVDAAKRNFSATSEIPRFKENICSQNENTSNDPEKETRSLRGVNCYTIRTHTCGELCPTDINKKVTICGWVEFIRSKFILIRDAHGTTQVILPEEMFSIVDNLHLETTVCVTGTVYARPKSQINKKYNTGEIEILAESIQIFAHARPDLPFHIRDYNKATEKTLNQHRYLALRFQNLQRNLRLRSELLFKMREFLIRSRNFVEVETPTLFKKTPGGAQEFIVPSHIKDKYYSLVQSPQQLKQLLMVGSIDRYFQIARCYRDEKTNTEKQPEFSQLDVELSFTNVDGVIKLTEEVLAASWPSTKAPLQIPFPRIPFKDALENYGSDKPCLIDEFRIQNLNKYVPDGGVSKHVYMFIIPDGKTHYSKLRDKFSMLSESRIEAVYTIKVPSQEKFHESLPKIVSDFDISKFRGDFEVKDNDLVIMAAGSNKLKTSIKMILIGTEDCNEIIKLEEEIRLRTINSNIVEERNLTFTNALKMLGLCRHHTINHLELIQKLNENGVYQFYWVVDFPLVELDDSEKLASVHHPFTQPHPEDVHLLDNDILKARSLAYDLVLNGSEIGGGSIRIHDAALQKKMFELLGLDESYFSHLIKALQMGCPPHGGIALGLDRLVAILCNCNSIRDVIAFPKSADGFDYMTECPNDIPIEDKIRYHIHTPSGKIENS